MLWSHLGKGVAILKRLLVVPSREGLLILSLWLVYMFQHLPIDKLPVSIFFKNGPIPASFCLFWIFSYNFNTNWKKHRWCAWDSNLGPQDGRRRRNHGAMAATTCKYLSKSSVAVRQFNMLAMNHYCLICKLYSPSKFDWIGPKPSYDWLSYKLVSVLKVLDMALLFFSPIFNEVSVYIMSSDKMAKRLTSLE